jgi:predicted phosphodiesterase
MCRLFESGQFVAARIDSPSRDLYHGKEKMIPRCHELDATRTATVLLLATALALHSCTYAGKSQTYVSLLEQTEASEIRKGLEGIVSSNSQVIREIARKQGTRRTPWLRFVVIGDTLSHHNLAYREMLTAISGLSPAPEFIINLGDFVAQDVESCSYYLETIRHYPHPLVHVMGNHEVVDEVERITRAIFGERDFFFDYDDVRFIFMGSDKQGMTDRRRGWLEALLKDDYPAQKIFLSHEFPTEPFKEVFPGLYSIFARKQENEKELLELLDRYEVPLAFFGHLHRHHQKIFQKTLMVISGGGGQRNQLEPRARHRYSTKQRHFTLIDLMAEKGEPFQGVITCITRNNEPLFMNSFIQRVPDLGAEGSDGRNGHPRMYLEPYDPSDLYLAHPPYLRDLYEAYVHKRPVKK